MKRPHVNEFERLLIRSKTLSGDFIMIKLKVRQLGRTIFKTKIMKKLFLTLAIGTALISCNKIKDHQVTFVNNTDVTITVESSSMGVSVGVLSNTMKYVTAKGGEHTVHCMASGGVSYIEVVDLDSDKVIELHK